MKIIQLQAENVKKLRCISITPEGNVIQITGENGSGKSSVLDSIFYALAGTSGVPSKVVRQGTDQATVRVNLGEHKTELTVTRTFSDGGKTTLTVENSDGLRFPSPQKMLDALLGELSFDPLEFTRMQPKDQLETLRGVVKLKVDIDELDQKIKIAYDKRTDVNRDIRTMEARIADFKLPDPLPQAEDESALLREMEKASSKNEGIAAEQQKRENARKNLKRVRDQIAELQKQEARFLHDLSLNELDDPVDLGVIRKKIEAARETNAILKQASNLDAYKRGLTKAQKESDALTRTIESCTDEKNDAISTARFPVKGLAFGNGEVIFNKLPFNQASQAEQLRVSVAIAMALNPKLRVLRIQDGSLLDKNSMKLLSEMAEFEDYQIWLETVHSTGKAQIVMEDGNAKEAK